VFGVKPVVNINKRASEDDVWDALEKAEASKR
jgi:hypothetical protein